MDKSHDTSVDIAWLHYVGGLTQAEIAKQRGLSKATVHRLLRAAHESGAVHVSIASRPSDVVALEQEVIARFGLRSCRLVPPSVTGIAAIRDGVARLAVQALLAQLETRQGCVIGLGAGRTLAAMARAFPRMHHPDAEFVSLTGDFSVFRIGHSTDVLRRLADRTGGTGYSIAAPILADSEADRQVLVSQSGTRIAFRKIAEAHSTFVGIGHLGAESFLTAFNLVSDGELEHLRRAGVVADFCGNLLDARGRPVDCAIARRMVASGFDDLAGKTNTAVAFGREKAPAIRAVLNAGLLSELIADHAAAEDLMAMP